MASILVLRHEDARPASEEGDALRALSPFGRTRMHRQARALFDALPGLDHVLCSPLVRATQTAEILVGAFALDTPVEATRVVSEPSSLGRLAERVVSIPAPVGVVAVVGHEPTMSSFVEHLTGEACGGLQTGEAMLLVPDMDRFEVRGGWRGGDSTHP